MQKESRTGERANVEKVTTEFLQFRELCNASVCSQSMTKLKSHPGKIMQSRLSCFVASADLIHFGESSERMYVGCLLRKLHMTCQ